MQVAAGIEPRFTSKFFDKLNEFQLVYFEPGQVKEDKVTILSSASDFSINTPLIIWNSASSTWSIYGGFNYINNYAWVNDGHSGPPYKNIGGEDALGFSLSNGANSATMVRQSLQAFYKRNPSHTCNTGYENQASFSSTSRDGNITNNQGVLFRGQDAVVTQSGSGCTAEFNRFGAGSAMAEYSSAFTAASGNVKSVFNHTWNTATITGVSFGTSGITITAGPVAQQTGTLAGSDSAY